MIQFQNLFIPEHVLFLPPSSKEEALSAIVDHLATLQVIQDKDGFYKALLQREHLMSTAIGQTAALPHAKLSTLTTFFLAIGIIKEGIDWHADDEMPVKCIFLIGGPDRLPIEYLSLLSNLTKALRSDEVIKKMIHATTEEEVVSALVS